MAEQIRQIYTISINPWLHLQASFDINAINYIITLIKEGLEKEYHIQISLLPNESQLKEVIFNHIETYRANVKPKRFYVEKLNSIEGHELMAKGRLHDLQMIVEKNDAEIRNAVEKEKTIFSLWANFLYLSLYPTQCNIEMTKYFMEYSDYDGSYGPKIMQELYFLIQQNKQLQEEIKVLKKKK